MTPERWRCIDEVFAAALELPPGEVAAWLDRACGEDHALRGAVEELLESDRRARGFLSRTESSERAAGPPAVPEGGRIGRYRLLHLLGQGGMGRVYLAVREDEVHRLVAVKTIRLDLDDPRVRERFAVERQLLAGLEHPYIARLYDGGTTESGEPYLVMELVEGEPIDRWCARRELAPEARLRLFLKVCSAVHHAHQNLLVHRDLKPENVLINADGDPKLLDFGIAEPLPAAAVPGAAPASPTPQPRTPAYASPEQLRGGPITTATDVFSLGVILYELLAGRSPYWLAGQPVAEDPRELERAILERQPPRPSEAAGAAGAGRGRRGNGRWGDLDAIVGKALAKDPSARYGSARELAEDLERHLDGRPVLARRQTRSYRWGKFLRRHRPAVAVASAMAVLLAGLTAGFLVVLWRQAERVAGERDKAQAALAFLTDTFAGADPYRPGDPNRTAREILDEAAGRSETELVGRPEVQAMIDRALGSLYLRLRLIDQAAPLLERSLATRRRLHGPRHPEVAESLTAMGSLHVSQGRLDLAEPLLREALDQRRELVGADSLETAATADLLGMLLGTDGRLDEAEALHRQALATRRRLQGEGHWEVADTLILLAQVERDQGRLAAAEAHFREALGSLRGSFGAEHARVAYGENLLGLALNDQGRFGEAEELFGRVTATQSRLLGPGHPDRLHSLNNLGLARFNQDRLAEAEAAYREALAGYRSWYGDVHPITAICANNLGHALSLQGDLAAADALHREALATLLATVGADHPMIARTWELQARVRQAAGEVAAARELLEKAQELVVRVLGAGHPDAARTLLARARLEAEAGEPAAAEALLGEAVAAARNCHPEGHWRRAEAEAELGAWWLRNGRADEGRALLETAVPVVEATLGPDHRRVRAWRELLAAGSG